MKKVRFIKYCPWSYRLTKGNLKKHLADSTAIVHPLEADAMIDAGYAKEITHEPAEKKVIAPKERKKRKKGKKGDKK
jgi:hypothetical protein